MATVSFPTDLYDELSRHPPKAPESVAFMRSAQPDSDHVFRVEELFLIDNSDSSLRNDDHCELNDEVRAAVIKWAWDKGGCLIEAHSHGLLFPPQFSRYDIAQLAAWLPHV